jgi:hypothetical protein
MKDKIRGVTITLRCTLITLLFTTTTASAADCKTPWFPTSAGVVLRYRQQVWTYAEGEDDVKVDEMEMVQDRFVASRGALEFRQTLNREGRAPAVSTTTYRCTDEGLVPVAQTSQYGKTTFNGVQYGSDLTDGKKWTFTWKSVGDGWTLSAQWDYRVIGPEKVEVPAGTFDAIRIDYRGLSTSSQRGKLPPTEGSVWIAEGIGLIKQADVDPALGLVPNKTTLELMARK